MKTNKTLIFFITFILILSLFIGIIPAPAYAAPDIFYRISISNTYVEANQPATILLRAEHFGRPIVNIPCTYLFQIKKLSTNEMVPECFDDSSNVYNVSKVTLPSNGGNLEAEINVWLEPGEYYIYYTWMANGEGPYPFFNFSAGIKITTPMIEYFSIYNSYNAILRGSSYKDPTTGKINRETNLITVDFERYHNNLSDAEATCWASNTASLTVNDRFARDDSYYFMPNGWQPRR